ncbi:MAG: ribosomal protein L24e family protein [Chlamydiales bacterium]|nr:ribosomal protein L24e family protein [Chlamydiales bacterium]
MVVKTELCNFSEWKIYPGKGVRFVAKDGRPFLFLSKRTRNFGLRKLKAQRLRWTTAWRRLHKKIKQSDTGKQKKKRVFKQERAIEGVTLDSIKKLKQAKPEDKKALAEEAIREIKERQKAQIAKRTAERKVVNKDKQTAQKAQDKAAQKAQKKNKKK